MCGSNVGGGAMSGRICYGRWDLIMSWLRLALGAGRFVSLEAGCEGLAQVR